MFQTSHPAVVLLVEDNPDYAYLTREAFEQARVCVDLHHVETGVACMAFLRRLPPYESAPRPDVILLDLHMPLMDGFEVMGEIDNDASLRGLPVVVLTSSSGPFELERIHKLRCSAYLPKPVDFAQLANVMRESTGYCFGLV